MTNKPYVRIAEVLDSLPNGFPKTETGVEIKLLKRIFRPEDTDLFCDLKLNFETAEQIANRTGRPLEGLEDHLIEMGKRGQIFTAKVGGTMVFKMVPWAFGIYELQRTRMDREMAEMLSEFMQVWKDRFFREKPQLMHVIPVEKEIQNKQIALNYEQVSNIIENSKSCAVFDCICKKEKQLIGHRCDKPLEVCTGYAPIPGFFDDSPIHRAITKQEAYDVLDKAEKAGLVHMTWNLESGHFFICNCCGCCCHVLTSINELKINASDVINSYYYAKIDQEECTACDICIEERCQVGAIETNDETNYIVKEKCIGCGLCVSTCPADAIEFIRKDQSEIVKPPKDEAEWLDMRAKELGKDLSNFML